MNKTIGILAHVDAGKTTLCEQILYNTNSIRKKGRVDHKNSFFDNNLVERNRGITVFSKEGYFEYNNSVYYLLDTPGHIDFSPEMERTLKILDYAIFVISGVEKVQSHSETIFKLLKKYKIPTIIFVNKMDRDITNKEEVVLSLKENISTDIFDFTNELKENISDELIEFIAERDEKLLEKFFEEDIDKNLFFEKLKLLFEENQIYPVVYGSALYNENIYNLVNILDKISKTNYKEDKELILKSFKIKEEKEKLVFMKVLQGKVKIKDEVSYLNNKISSNESINIISEKINDIRIYNGDKFIKRNEAYAGEIIAVTGLSELTIGRYIVNSDNKKLIEGLEKKNTKPDIIPTLKTKVIFKEDVNIKDVYSYFRILGEEDPSLNPIYNEELKEIQISILGKIQLEVLKEVILDRFNLSVEFGPCEILYKETIAKETYGVGHFEPLKHYAEVVLKIEPTKRNSGISFESVAHVDNLGIGHQNLVKTHVFERNHRGILGGYELTDIKITLITGKCHLKHTEGGDFRQATYRALRQGIEKVENILLEPFYKFKIQITSDYIGRVISDLQKMSCNFNIEEKNNKTIIYGRGPVSCLMDYPLEIVSFTKGSGNINLEYDGYDKCHNQEEVLKNNSYDKNSDKTYTSNSIFCKKGESFTVKGENIKDYMHCELNKDLQEKI